MFNLECCTKDYIDYPYDSIALTYQIVFHYEKYDIYLKLHSSGHLSFALYKEMDDGSRDVETEFIEYCHVCLSKINYMNCILMNKKWQTIWFAYFIAFSKFLKFVFAILSKNLIL